MGQRPDHLKPPAYLTQSPPVPEPGPARPRPANPPEAEIEGDDPTRYGDWTHKGIAIDF